MSIVYVILSKVEFLVGGFRLNILSFLVLIGIRMRIKTRISEYSNWQGPDFMGPLAYFCLSRTCFFTKELAQNTKGIFVLQCLAIFAQFFLCLRVFHPIDKFVWSILFFWCLYCIDILFDIKCQKKGQDIALWCYELCNMP